MSRKAVGCLQSEQLLVCEEGIWPALMVGLADSSTWSMVPHAQDGTQPPSHEAVDIGEHPGRGMLEVADPRKALAPAAARFSSHLVLD